MATILTPINMPGRPTIYVGEHEGATYRCFRAPDDDSYASYAWLDANGNIAPSSAHVALDVALEEYLGQVRIAATVTALWVP